MREIRRHEDEVVGFVFVDSIADIALAMTVHRQRQLVLRVVMPFERNTREPPMVNPDRTVLAELDVLVSWFHGRKRK
jgi:hypothetical protein